jgi:hypothetical protein
MTMREENAWRVDGWLEPAATAKLSSKTLRIEGFDDDEAHEAAQAIAQLRPLLADSHQYDTVLRRPFFLDALSHLSMPAGGEVRSEVDLVELWRAHGGADGADFALPRTGAMSYWRSASSPTLETQRPVGVSLTNTTALLWRLETARRAANAGRLLPTSGAATPTDGSVSSAASMRR